MLITSHEKRPRTNWIKDKREKVSKKDKRTLGWKKEKVARKIRIGGQIEILNKRNCILKEKIGAGLIGRKSIGQKSNGVKLLNFQQITPK